MTNNEKVSVLIGRFQTSHKAHLELFKHGLTTSDHLIVLVGSSDVARDPANPFSFEERKSVIERICADYIAPGKRLSVLPIHDFVYDNTKWLNNVQRQVASVTMSRDITLLGCKKDVSSFYLDFFPQWGQDFIEVQHDGIGATDYRLQYFRTGEVSTDLPVQTQEFLHSFKLTDAYTYVKSEQRWYDDNVEVLCQKITNPHTGETLYVERRWKPTYVTGDALVTCAGHILVIRRKNAPGKGQLALPGGYINQKETIEAMIARELREETKLRVPPGVVQQALKHPSAVTVFADAGRSLRGRIITHCGKIVLHDTTLPKVRGADDAEKAFWMPISEVIERRAEFFEDHLSIIDAQLNIL